MIYFVLLFQENKNYWTYSGSLTTPPCHESVRFLIFQNPIQMSERQVRSDKSLINSKLPDENQRVI